HRGAAGGAVASTKSAIPDPGLESTGVLGAGCAGESIVAPAFECGRGHCPEGCKYARGDGGPTNGRSDLVQKGYDGGTAHGGLRFRRSTSEHPPAPHPPPLYEGTAASDG